MTAAYRVNISRLKTASTSMENPEPVNIGYIVRTEGEYGYVATDQKTNSAREAAISVWRVAIVQGREKNAGFPRFSLYASEGPRPLQAGTTARPGENYTDRPTEKDLAEISDLLEDKEVIFEAAKRK